MNHSFRFLGQGASPPRPWDQILVETQNFVVVPTLGAIVEGWLLVIPKRGYLSFAAIEAQLQSEAASVTALTKEIVQACYGSVAVFEHGPASRGQRVGCGVDHAHLHIVPTTRPLLPCVPLVTESKLNWHPTSSPFDASRYISDGTSYLYLEESDTGGLIAPADDAPSQLFRRVIAHQNGIPEQFDWREHAMEANVRATVRTISKYLLDENSGCISAA